VAGWVGHPVRRRYGAGLQQLRGVPRFVTLKGYVVLLCAVASYTVVAGWRCASHVVLFLRSVFKCASRVLPLRLAAMPRTGGTVASMTSTRVLAGLVGAGLLLAGCAAQPVLGGQARVDGQLVQLAPGGTCTAPGAACPAPVLEASPGQVLELGVPVDVQIALTVAPEAVLAPRAGEDGRWQVPLEGVPAGLYVLTLVAGSSVEQLQLKVS
jgi:hypothetical protein